MSATTKISILLSLTFCSVAFASAYSQYRLIKQEVINNQTVCTYENARGRSSLEHTNLKSNVQSTNTDRE